MKEESTDMLVTKEQDYLLFAQEEPDKEEISSERWKLLIVDDEQEVHAVTKMVLNDFRYDGKALEFISAYSAKEATELIEQYTDIAVILLDVVMEENDSGLKFVKYVREEKKNKLVRIILRTGEPGEAPEDKVILCYDINDYKEKAELTSKKLFTAMVSALRSYRDITVIDASRKGLETVIKSSVGMLKMQSMKEFASAILSQLVSILHLEDAIFCKVETQSGREKKDIYIVAATDGYIAYIGKKIKTAIPREEYANILKALNEKKSFHYNNHSVIYFQSYIGSESLIYIKGENELEECDRNLIEVFSENVSNAFDNIHLNKEVLDNLKDAIVVVNNLNRIVTFNNSFSNTFFKNIKLKNCDNISTFVKILKYSAIKDESGNQIINAIEHGSDIHINGELILNGDDKKCYSVNIQPVFDGKKVIIGRVISLNDITVYKTLLEKLKEHAATVEELAIVRERNRMAMDMHDTLGHTITLLIALLEVSAITCRNNPQKSEEKIALAIGVARDGLREVRRSITGLMPERLEENNLKNALENLIEEFESSGMVVDFSADEISEYLNPIYSDAIYRVCQEALTNSLRHGKAKNVSIILKCIEGWIKLFIIDDGVGCKIIHKGYGLCGMEHRVGDLKGKIAYGSDGERGFNIHVEIPVSMRA